MLSLATIILLNDTDNDGALVLLARIQPDRRRLSYVRVSSNSILRDMQLKMETLVRICHMHVAKRRNASAMRRVRACEAMQRILADRDATEYAPRGVV